LDNKNSKVDTLDKYAIYSESTSNHWNKDVYSYVTF